MQPQCCSLHKQQPHCRSKLRCLPSGSASKGVSVLPFMPPTALQVATPACYQYSSLPSTSASHTRLHSSLHMPTPLQAAPTGGRPHGAHRRRLHAYHRRRRRHGPCGRGRVPAAAVRCRRRGLPSRAPAAGCPRVARGPAHHQPGVRGQEAPLRVRRQVGTARVARACL